MSRTDRLKMIARPHVHYTIVEQCALLGVPRSTLYYKPEPVSDEDLKLMRRIDEIYTKWPFYGARRIVEELREEGYVVNRERVRRLMRLMGIEAIYPKPNTSRKHPSHKIYPYLLKNLVIDRPNQVWCADYNLYPDGQGMGVSRGRHGLVQPPCLGVAPLDHNGDGFLCRGLARGPGHIRQTGNLQHGSGRAVYGCSIHRNAGSSRCPDQHGRQRALSRQHFYRTPLAQLEI